MLPQGEFATFLKGRSSERQKLLGDLLNLGEVARWRSPTAHREAETAKAHRG